MKLAIACSVILTVTLIARVESGVVSDIISIPVRTTKNAVDQLILNTLARLQEALKETQGKVDEFVGDAKNWVDSKRAEIHNNFKEISNKVDQRIYDLKIWTEDYGYDLRNCEKIAQEAQKNLVRVTDESIGCVMDRVLKVTTRMDPLGKKLSDMIRVLTKMLRENAECIEDPNSSTAQMIACLTNKNVKATYQITRRVPRLLFETGKFTVSTVFSPLPTGYCIAKNSILATTEQTSLMLNEVQQCAKSQMKRLSGDTKTAYDSATSTESVTEPK